MYNEFFIKHNHLEKLNHYGFRSPIVDSEKKILFIGCSMTYGQGVEYQQTFAYQTANKLGKEWSCLNMGIPGSGPDLQIAVMTWALNTFKVDKICWLMSDPMRTTLYIGKDDCRITFNSDDGAQFNNLNNSIKIRTDIELFKKNHVYFEKNYLKKLKYNIYTLFSLIKQKNIDCYVTCWIDSFDEELQEFKDMFNFKSLGNAKWLDLASDNSHFGPESHLEFSHRIAGMIQNDK